MNLKTLLVMTIFVLVIAGIAGAAIDPWIDQNNVVTSNATGETSSLVSAAARPSAPASEESATANKPAAAGPQVELYVTSWCPYCKQAENFFRSQGIPYTAYDIEKDSSAARRKEQLDSSRGVPFAIINGQMIRGYSAEAYREALKKKP
jgi:glutaredoxin